MTRIRLELLLPYSIAIPANEYEVYAARHLRKIEISHPTQIVHETDTGSEILSCEAQSLVSMAFTTDVDLEIDQNVLNEFARCANITLTTTNRLVDWYRVQTGRHHVTALVLPQIEFARLSAFGPPMRQLIVYRYKPSVQIDEILSDDEVQILQQNLVKTVPPPLEELLLLDAEEAFSQHRYKECTLICWSIIESTFDPLIRAKLKEKLPDIGFDIGQSGWNIERNLWFFTRLDVLPRLLASPFAKGGQGGFSHSKSYPMISGIGFNAVAISEIRLSMKGKTLRKTTPLIHLPLRGSL